MFFLIVEAILCCMILGFSIRAFGQELVSMQSDDGSVHVSFPETDRGLFCDRFTIAIGDDTIECNGFACSFADEKTTVAKADWTRSDSQLTVRHELSDGSSVLADLWLDETTRALQCRFSQLDNVSRIEVGGLRSGVRRLYCDSGWVVERPSKAHRRPRIMADFVVLQRDDGWFELQACDMSGGYRFDPADNRCSLFTLHRVPQATVTILLGRDGVPDLVRKYRRLADASAPRTIDKLAHRFLLDDWTGVHTRETVQQLERLRYYGCTRLVLLFHNWQHFGYDVKLPDIFPPHERVGGTAGMRALAEYCRDHSIPFGLHDNYSDIYPDAPGFKQEYAGLLPKEWRREDRKYYQGWFNQSSGVRAYGWAADAVSDTAKRNFDLIGKAFPTTTYFLDVTSYSDPKPFEHPDGVFHSPADDLRYGRALYDLARTSFGDAPVVGEGCTQKYLGAVDAAGCDLWSPDRWGVDPGPADWEYYPLFNLAFHPEVILYGVGYPARYKLPNMDFSADIFSEQFLDDYRSTRILFGNSGFWQTVAINLSMDDVRVIKEYYLSLPLAEQIERAEVVSITLHEDNLHRVRVDYANGLTVWVNRGFTPWKVEEYVLPQYGVMVKGDDFFQATISMWNSRVDVVESESLLFLDARSRRCTNNGVTTDGMLAVERTPDTVIVRPIDRVTYASIDFQKLQPDRDFNNATVTVMGWNDEKLREFAINGSTVTLDESTPLKVVTDKLQEGTRTPFSYYPYYVVTPRS